MARSSAAVMRHERRRIASDNLTEPLRMIALPTVRTKRAAAVSRAGSSDVFWLYRTAASSQPGHNHVTVV
ncbi:MAG TPA: hypothetical protein VIH29_04240 [Gallionella sp.]